MISETCSCGARIKTDEANAEKLVKNWRRSHKCLSGASEADYTHTVDTANTTLALGFQPGEMPAKQYDPWEDE